MAESICFFLMGCLCTFLFAGGVSFMTAHRTDLLQVNDRKHNLWFLIGHMMLVVSVLFVLWTVLKLVFPVGHWIFVLLNMFYLLIFPSFLYNISCTMRYGAGLKMSKVLPHFLPLMLAVIYFYVHVFWLLILAVAVLVIYCLVLGIHHHRWCKLHLELWEHYDSKYVESSVKQFGFILVPIMLQGGLVVLSYFQGGYLASCVNIVVSLCLWGVVLFFALRFVPVPDSEAAIENEIAKEEHVDIKSESMLSSDVRAKIARRLVDAKVSKMYLRQGIDVAAYAEYVGTNRTYLSRYLKETYEQTFSKYLESLRMEEAKRLLDSGERLTPLLLCTRCGYSDQASFGRHFQAYFGCTPSRYFSEHKRS